MGLFLEEYGVKRRWDVDTVAFMLANMGEKILIRVGYYYEDIVFANADNKITLAPVASSIDTLNNTHIIKSEDGVAFSEYKVNDTARVFTAGPNTFIDYLVTEVLEDGAAVRTNTDLSGIAGDLTDGSYVANVTPMAGHKYFYNFIEQEDGVTFVSKIDGETQLLKSNEGDASDTINTHLMIFNGKKSYQIGDARIVGAGNANASQHFLITHNTFLTPFFLINQLNDLIDSAGPIAPEYYLANKCLRHVARIEVTKSLSDPNPAQILQIDEILGNTGWLNENFNGGINFFSIINKTCKRVSDNAPIPSLQLDQPSEYNFIIEATSPAGFDPINTKVTCQFCYLPEDESQYQDNGRDLRENFVFDDCLANVGLGPVAGTNNPTTLKVITEFEVTYLSSTQLAVRIRVDLGSLSESIITQGDFMRYLLWVGTETAGLGIAKSDGVNLVVDVTEFFEDLQDTNIVSAETTFVNHTGTDPDTDGAGFLNAYPVDDIVSHVDFSIDYAAGLPILIKKVQPKIVLKKAGEVDIELESISLDTSASSLENGIIPFISLEQDRAFTIPPGIRKTITLDRRDDLDVGSIKHWVLNYPFMVRWEYWIELGILDNLPAGIFDTSKPFNGLNHFWYRFTTITGWSIFYETRFVLEMNGQEFEQTIEKQFSIMDFASNSEWDTKTIESFTLADVPLESGGVQFISGYEDTKIVATFEKVSGDIPDVADIAIEFRIIPKEIGTEDDARIASSLYDIGPESWFKTVDDVLNRVVVEDHGSGVFTGTVAVDYTKLSPDSDFTIYARIFDPSAVTPDDAIITEAGDFVFTEDEDYLIEE